MVEKLPKQLKQTVMLLMWEKREQPSLTTHVTGLSLGYGPHSGVHLDAKEQWVDEGWQ